MTAVHLPGHGLHRLGEPAIPNPPAAPPTSRVVYAAAHVVADPLADNGSGRPARLDWDATVAFRRHLWRHGLGVAEAMDTAQRGMGLDWDTTRRLIETTAAQADGDRLACGVGTDHLPADRPVPIDRIVDAYTEQLAVVVNVGATPILMCSRALAAVATGPDDYAHVYSTVLGQLREPVILHWLGPMFDPALTGYWGSFDLDAAADTLLAIVSAHAHVVDGVKISLLDAEAEIAFRSVLPRGVRCYSGDDFHYPRLIAGDADGHSDALLGIFDPLAPFAAAAVHALDTGDVRTFHGILDPTVALARKVFEAPTRDYKTGVVFLAWLCGHQTHFRMVDGRETARSVAHLCDVFVLADRIGLYPDPDLAAARMRGLLSALGADR